jgi:hypothetical protein
MLNPFSAWDVDESAIDDCEPAVERCARRRRLLGFPVEWDMDPSPVDGRWTDPLARSSSAIRRANKRNVRREGPVVGTNDDAYTFQGGRKQK